MHYFGNSATNQSRCRPCADAALQAVAQYGCLRNPVIALDTLFERMQQLGIAPAVSADAFFSQLDSNGDGAVDKAEFDARPQPGANQSVVFARRSPPAACPIAPVVL